MALPLILWEIPFYLSILLIKQVGRPLYFQTYLELLLDNFRRFGKSTGFNLKDVIAYPYYLWKLEGPLVCILLIVGSFKCLKSHKSADLIVLIPFIIPLAFFSFFSADFPRFLVISIPFISIIAGRSLDFNLKLTKYIELSTLCTLLVLLWGIYNCSHIINLKTGMRDAFSYLDSIGAKKHLTTHYEMSVFYTKNKKFIKDIREDVRDYKHLKALYREGYRYLLCDVQKYITRFPHWPFEPPEILTDIENSCQPIKTFENNRGNFLQHWFKHCVVSFQKTLDFYHNLPLKEKLGLKIYDLKDYFKAKE